MTTAIKKLKVASRQSALAKKQVEILNGLLADRGITVDFDLIPMDTMGDKDKKLPLTQNSADNFFTDTLDEAVLSGTADIAIHSAKDLPQILPEGLSLYALTASPDETDAFVGRVPFGQLVDGAKVGTSSVIRQEQVKALNPDVEIVDIRGTINERIELVEQGKVDGIIAATIALKRLGLEDKITDIMPWEGAPLQGQLAVVGKTDNIAVQALFSSIDVRSDYGKVVLVGAGPGDPDLITVKGIEALKQTDCVFYDFLAHTDLLNYAQQAEQIYVGKRKGAHALAQDELSRTVRLKAMEGKNVVRLKGGDPLIFGRGAEEIEYLRSYHIDVDVVPGVSSATAIPSSLGIPLTARNKSSSVAFISGHGKGEQSTKPQPVNIPDVDTIVFLMGLTKLDLIVDSLKAKGWKEHVPVIVISKGTCEDEKIICGTVGTIVSKVRQAKLQPPALIIAGATVDFWNQYTNRQKKILYTGTNPEQVKPLGPVVHLPMIHISRKELMPEEQEQIIHYLNTADMILFTSRYAVRFFFALIDGRHFDRNRLSGHQMIAIGKATAKELEFCGIRANLISEVETGEGLLASMRARFDLKGKKIFFPRSSLPNPFLREELTKLGAHVEEATLYNNEKLPKRALPTDSIDRVVFTSPSTVKNFLQDYERIPNDWMILSQGPVTQRSLKEAGYDSKVLMHD